MNGGLCGRDMRLALAAHRGRRRGCAALRTVRRNRRSAAPLQDPFRHRRTGVGVERSGRRRQCRRPHPLPPLRRRWLRSLGKPGPISINVGLEERLRHQVKTHKPDPLKSQMVGDSGLEPLTSCVSNIENHYNGCKANRCRGFHEDPTINRRTTSFPPTEPDGRTIVIAGGIMWFRSSR